MNLRLFLRLQSDSYLTDMRDALALEISAYLEYSSISVGGKSSSMRKLIRVEALAVALADVLIERGLQGSDYVKKERMTQARFV